MKDKCDVAKSVISKIFKHTWTRRAFAISIVLCSVSATVIVMYEYVIK
jgi:hypothetical protein